MPGIELKTFALARQALRCGPVSPAPRKAAELTWEAEGAGKAEEREKVPGNRLIDRFVFTGNSTL